MTGHDMTGHESYITLLFATIQSLTRIRPEPIPPHPSFKKSGGRRGGKIPQQITESIQLKAMTWGGSDRACMMVTGWGVKRLSHLNCCTFELFLLP